jgi:hypothetical protein
MATAAVDSPESCRSRGFGHGEGFGGHETAPRGIPHRVASKGAKDELQGDG